MKTEVFIRDLILAGIRIIEIPIDGIAGRIGRRMEIHFLGGRSKLSFSNGLVWCFIKDQLGVLTRHWLNVRTVSRGSDWFQHNFDIFYIQHFNSTVLLDHLRANWALWLITTLRNYTKKKTGKLQNPSVPLCIAWDVIVHG